MYDDIWQFIAVSAVSIIIGLRVGGFKKAEKDSVDKLNKEINILSSDLKSLSNNRIYDMQEIVKSVVAQVSEFKKDIYQKISSVEQYAVSQYNNLKTGIDSISENILELNKLIGEVQGEIKRITGV